MSSSSSSLLSSSPDGRCFSRADFSFGPSSQNPRPQPPPVMATPASAVSDVGEPQAEEPPQAEAVVAAQPEGPEAGAAATAESAGASNQSALAAAASGDASSAPAPTTTPDSAAAPPPASPAARAAPGPARPQFAGFPAYMAPPSPSPAFSFNVLPRAPPAPQIGGGAASLHPGSSPVGILSYSLL